MNKKEKILKEIEKFFEKHEISGIIRVPNAGTYSLFGSEDDKLLVLEHFKVELLAREKYINSEANKLLGWDNSIDKKDKNEVRNYIG